MKTVGIRERKDHLSAYLRVVKEGGSVEITERGRVVAVLNPPAPPHEDEFDEWLKREGLLMRPALSQDRSFLEDWTPGGCPDGTAENLIAWLRRDKWEPEDE